jgi:hypothetical protein
MPQKFPGRTEENHQNHKSGQPISRPRFEHWTSRTWKISCNHSIMTFPYYYYYCCCCCCCCCCDDVNSGQYFFTIQRRLMIRDLPRFRRNLTEMCEVRQQEPGDHSYIQRLPFSVFSIRPIYWCDHSTTVNLVAQYGAKYRNTHTHTLRNSGFIIPL